MMDRNEPKTNKELREGKAGGTLAAFGAYVLWGLFPLYWHMLNMVDPLQILAHRIIWASFFCFVTLAIKGRLSDVAVIFRDRKRFFLIGIAGLVVTSNWGVYIWAVNSGRVTEASLGYYINPILSVVLGAAVFRERLDRWTVLSISVAAAGILGAALLYGTVPWVSLFLAVTFAVYGALKKRAGVDPLAGLAAETLVTAPLALGWLLFCHTTGQGAFVNAGLLPTFLLICSGVVTAIPLLLFASAANAIPLQLMGFIQYISPSLQLFLGIVVFGERPDAARLIALAAVAAAILIYVFSRRKTEAA